MIDPLHELHRLAKALDERAEDIAKADRWYSGDHPIPNPPPNTAAAVDADARRAFEAMSQLAVTNLLPPIVDVPASKLHVEGFRFSDSPTSTDNDAYRIWMRNHMDVEDGIRTHAALRVGSAPVIVWIDDNDRATIDVEDPAQVIVAYVAGSRRLRRSALKRWVDDDGYTCATVYLPDAIYKFRTAHPSATALELPKPASGSEWVRREVAGEEWPVPNRWGEVPVFEQRANPGIKPAPFGGGTPEFAKQINEQRRINQTVLDALVTMEYQAFRQRWVTGWDFPMKDDGTPDKTAMLKASAARLMTFSSDPTDAIGSGSGEIKVGEFAQADFQPFVKMLEAWTKVMASTSGTPPYAFLLGDMINVAADALARIDGVQITKVRSHARSMGANNADAIRFALRIEGNPKAADPVITTVWAEHEERTGSEQAEMAKIAHELGAPDEAVFAMLPGVDAAEAARWARQRQGRALLFADSSGDAEAS